MISYFSFLYLVVSGSRKDDVELGLMISKSLIASVPNNRPPMSFQKGLQRRGRSFHRLGEDTDQLCYLNKIKHDMETVVDDFICGNDLTRRYLVDNVRFDFRQRSNGKFRFADEANKNVSDAIPKASKSTAQR